MTTPNTKREYPTLPPLPPAHVIGNRPTAPDGDMYCLGYEAINMVSYAKRYADPLIAEIERLKAEFEEANSIWQSQQGSKP